MFTWRLGDKMIRINPTRRPPSRPIIPTKGQNIRPAQPSIITTKLHSTDNLHLHVCIPTRERLNMTRKTIESIYESCTEFKHNNIHIYIFDNGPVPSPERVALFNNLLETNQIEYYSYEKDYTLHGCFAKSVLFQRFCKMMVTRATIHPTETNYYMMCDNDMLFCNDWDSYFISATNHAPEEICYLVKFPGGLSCAKDPIKDGIECPHDFGKPSFRCVPDNMGGSSGTWFMNYNMLTKTMWTDENLKLMLGRKNYDDGITWKLLRQKYPGKNYVLRVVPPEGKLFILHLGDIVGSIVNAQKANSYNDTIVNENKSADEELANMTCSEIEAKYGSAGHYW